MNFSYHMPIEHYHEMNQPNRNHHHFGGQSHQGQGNNPHHRNPNHHGTQQHHFGHDYHYGSSSQHGGMKQHEDNYYHGSHHHHDYNSKAGTGLGALGSLLGLGLSYLGSGFTNGAALSDYGGYGGGSPYPGPYGFGPGKPGYGYPGAYASVYPGLTPTNYIS